MRKPQIRPRLVVAIFWPGYPSIMGPMLSIEMAQPYPKNVALFDLLALTIHDDVCT